MKRPIRHAGMAVVAATLLLTTAACGSNNGASTSTTAQATATPDTSSAAVGNVVDVAISAGSFTVLAQLLTATGLVETLSGPGPFTVFAPTDAAFEAVAAGQEISLDEMVKGLIANPKLLTDMLLYHVVSGNIPAAEVVTLNGKDVETLSGEKWTVIVAGEKVSIEDGFGRMVNVIDVDVSASNGVIHVIDSVLDGALPDFDGNDQEAAPTTSEFRNYDETFDGSTSKNIVEDLAAAGNFTALIEMLTAGGQIETLSGPGPFTVFAPTDAAFESVAAELGIPLEDLLSEVIANPEMLVYTNTHHVVSGKLSAAELAGMNGQKLETLAGVDVTVIVDGEKISLKDGRGRIANVIDANVAASNGVIHVLDNVLA
ncbi:unannotated protein [freshwater metagenome]|uniref:Unannotated protein n=1 Tax=freshwater metagenome TaxID=449393 RepID=A0A6J7GC24_9ZZZZ|nr:hypothetical protein [Actinomycetota bacterium]